MHSFSVAKSPSTAASISTTTRRATASGVSQPESVIEKHQQGSFVGFVTTVHTPESTYIPAADKPFARLRLLAEVSASQVDPFDALAAYRTVTSNEKDVYQGQPDDSLSLSNEPTQPVKGSEPIVRNERSEVNLFISPATNGSVITSRTTASIPDHEILPSIGDHFRRALSGTAPEALLTAIARDLRFVSATPLTVQEPDLNNEWVILTGDKKKLYKCTYEGCCKLYSKKHILLAHIATHTGKSHLRCFLGECNGEIGYRDKYLLNRHIIARHAVKKPYQCEICEKRFGRKDRLNVHRRNVHSIVDKKKPPKRKKK